LTIFDHPLIAVVLGLIAGLAMMAVVFFAPKLEKTGEPLKRWPYIMVGNVLALLIGMGVIYGYHVVAPHSFVWFSLMAILSFILLLFISALSSIRQLKRRVK
jgi:drug/metabolite transporter (DMT)-like permease